MFTYTPTIETVTMAQSSPYPCDDNVIAVQIYTNVPLIWTCEPMFTLTGLTGTTTVDPRLAMSDYTANLIGHTNDTADGTALWDGSAGTVSLTVLQGTTIPWGDTQPTFEFKIPVTNGNTPQSAPMVTVSMTHTGYHGTTSWAVIDAMPYAQPDAGFMSLWETKNGNAIYNWEGEATAKTPMYLRMATFISHSVGQTSPWPAAQNTIGVTLRFNSELIVGCAPIVRIYNFKEACFGTSHVEMGGAEAASFSSLEGSVGFASWNETGETITLRANNSVAGASILADTDYEVILPFENPTLAQDPQDIAAEIFFASGAVPAYYNATYLAQDFLTVLSTAGLPYFNAGDALPLKVYAPEFIERSIRQSNPLPGQMNTITITVASNVELAPPAAITISGLRVEDSYRADDDFLPLAETGSLPIAAEGGFSCPADGTAYDAFGAGTQYAYDCQDGSGLFQDYVVGGTPSNVYFDEYLGKLQLNLATTMLAGVRYSFTFTVQNPTCGHAAVSPCIRANRIITNCTRGMIARTLMATDAMTTDGMEDLVTDGLVDGLNVLNAVAGEALPLYVRAPALLSATVEQSTTYPADTNMITICIATSVPLMATLSMNITVTGLIGTYEYPSPASGTMTISNADGYFGDAAWDVSTGVMVIPMIADTVAGDEDCFEFTVVNPSMTQACETLSIEFDGMCYGSSVAIQTYSDPTHGTDLPMQGECGDFNVTNTPFTIPVSAFGYQLDMPNGRCPVLVEQPSSEFFMISQDNSFPCLSNFLTLTMATSVPLDLVTPMLTLTGLDGTMTSDDLAMAITAELGGVQTGITGKWFNNGTLVVDISAVAPSSPCDVLSLKFELKNQATPRSAATVFAEVNGLRGFSIASTQVLNPSGYLDWYEGLTGHRPVMTDLYLEDPLYVETPTFTFAKMGQTTAWPGTTNTLTVTFATNVPLTPDCATIVITNMEEACATDGSTALGGADAGSFHDGDGNAAVGIWAGVADASRPVTQGSLTFVPDITTTEEVQYVLSWEVTNPVAAQNSPGIMIQVDGLGPIDPTLVDKDLETVPANPCPAGYFQCDFAEGDAAPLRVMGPMFLQKDVSQSTPYPSLTNTLSVTLLTNIDLSVGALVTITSLSGARTATGEIALAGANAGDFQAGQLAAASTGAWDFDAHKLTLRVANALTAGVQIIFSFDLENPHCEQPSPEVCVRASRISTSCLDCTQGQCVTLPRQAMDRDLATIFSYGSLGSALYDFAAYYDETDAAVVTYGTAPPQLGDAYPLLVYAGAFISADIVQETPFPEAVNAMTVSFATDVPLIAGSRVTLAGLAGSQTEDTTSMAVSEPAGVNGDFDTMFSNTAVWFNNGTLILTVDQKTVAGTEYTFTFDLLNPICANEPPSVSIKASPVCLSWTPVSQDTVTVPSVFGAEAGDARPLKVKSPEFLTKKVWQDSPYPGDDNVINLELSTNVNMQAGVKVTIDGFMNFQTADSWIAVSSTPGGVYNTSGYFSNDNTGKGTIVVELIGESTAGTNYSLDFTLVNPSCCQGESTITVDTDLECAVQVDMHTQYDEALLDGGAGIDEGTNMESAPSHVRCPAWVHAVTTQSTEMPCMDNTIEVEMALNVPIWSGTMITLSGFTDTRTEDGELELLAMSDTIGKACAQGGGDCINFTKADGMVWFPVMTDISPMTNLTFSFSVINPVAPVATKTIILNADPVCDLAADYVVGQPSDPVISVEQAEFTVKNIGQSTPWPAATNVITVTLDSNVPLYGEGFHCPTNITIHGLEGACIDEYPTLMGANASIFNETTWYDDLDTMEMDIIGPLGVDGYREAVFSFTVRNPPEAQPSPRIQISALGIPIAASSMDKDESALDDSTYDHNTAAVDDSAVAHVGSANGAIFNSTERDAEPLKVYGPAFLVKDIGQSSPYPGDMNTLGVTLMPNIDLDPGSVVTISVLDHVDGTPAATSGAITLFDGSSAPMSKTTTSDQDFFAASTDGTPGEGLWDDEVRTLTLFVVSKMTAGSYFSFSFVLQNALCAQDAQPVCIRARNLKAGCDDGIRIPRRLMDHDTATVPDAYKAVAGDAAPLLTYQPVIEVARLQHSTPWPSLNNTLTVTFATNVPLLDDLFNPRITLTGLTETQTPSGFVSVTMTDEGGASEVVNASWDTTTGAIDFRSPMSTTPGENYTLVFDLVNKRCQQSSPTVNMDITDICFDQKLVTPVPLLACDVPTLPLEVLGGPCSVAETSSALFTAANISQDNSYPGCNNTITVTFTVSVPLTYMEEAEVVIDFDNTLTVGLAPGVVALMGDDADHFEHPGDGNSSAAHWDPSTNTMTLKVSDGMDLEACVPYTFSFMVSNPMDVPSPFSTAVLQEASTMDVMISATGVITGSTIGDLIVPQAMVVPMAEMLSLPETDGKDLYPFRTQALRFMVKDIGQSTPQPGSSENTLTVTFAANTNMRVGSVIAIHNIRGAIAADGDMDLDGDDATYFESLEGTAEHGTWNDCEKALVLVVRRDLGCGGDNFTVSFTVYNPVQPQLCAEVMINATKLPTPSVFVTHQATLGAEPAAEGVITASNPDDDVWDGVVMDPDMVTVPDVYGAGMGDACPMFVWPAAFLVKEIGQSIHYPCALNTITVTLATNTPLFAAIEYPGRDVIRPSITISRILGAVVDDIEGDGKSIPLLMTKNSSLIGGQRVDADASYFIDDDILANSSHVTFMKGVAPFEGEGSVTMYLQEGQPECCVPGNDDFRVKFSFNVYNPASAQDPSNPISITASGIPIIASAMLEAVGTKRPMYVLEPLFTRNLIAQSTSNPCAVNTITVSLMTNVMLYERCSPKVTIAGLEGVVANMSIDIADMGSPVESQGTWYENTGVLVVNITGEEVDAGEEITFSFDTVNPKTPLSPVDAPSAVISGINMVNVTMDRETDPLSWPVTVEQAMFETKAIGQSTPYPAALNTLTITLETNVDLAEDCNVAITISGLRGACVETDDDGYVELDVEDNEGSRFKGAVDDDGEERATWDAESESLIFWAAGDGIQGDTEYVIHVNVRNPASAQNSPMVFIEASGIPIARVAMDRNPEGEIPDGVFEGTVAEGSPLEVRGLTVASDFTKKTIGQSVADPGATNTITVTIQVNVPLTAASPESTLTISGLSGARALTGPMDIEVETDAADGEFEAEWNAEKEMLVLTITEDTLPGEDYVISFEVTNPILAQGSPSVFIESSGIVIQPQMMEAGSGALETLNEEGDTVDTSVEAKAPLFILAPRIIQRTIYKSDGTYWPAQDSQITMTFTPTVVIEPVLGGVVSILVSGLHGVVLEDDSVEIGGADAEKFTDCDELDLSECGAGMAKWDDMRHVLTLNVLKKLEPFEAVTVTLDFENAMDGQEPPEVFIALTNGNQRISQGLRMSKYMYDDSEPASMNSTMMSDLFSSYSANVTVMVDELPSESEDFYEALGENSTLDNTLFEFEGMLSLPASGAWTFALQCSDACEMLVDGQVVVFQGGENDVVNATTTEGEAVMLSAGMLSFRIRLQQIDDAVGVVAMAKAPGAEEFEEIPEEWLMLVLDIFELAPQPMLNAEMLPGGLTASFHHITWTPPGDATDFAALVDAAELQDEEVVSGPITDVNDDEWPDDWRTSEHYVLYEGSLKITEPGQYVFATAVDDAVKVYVDDELVASYYGPYGSKPADPVEGETVILTEGSHSFSAHHLQGDTGVSGIDVYWKTPDSDDWEKIPSTSFLRKADRALYIMPSASFTTKEVSQSTTAPGATNTISIVLRPQFTLTGDAMSTITISGLIGSATPDKNMMLLDANPTFNATARWIARTGTLVLLVAPGQEVPDDADTTIMFDLTNPNVPQEGPQLVQVSAMGDVPISAAAMDLGAGDAAPLKVVSSSFTELGINSSTTAPDATNTITVTFQADVVLSSSRRSAITVQGLIGSASDSTMALPIQMIEGDAATFLSPMPEMTISFSPECALADNKVLVMAPGSEDLEGTVLFFKEGGCEERWSKVAAYDEESKCATLEVNAQGKWSDGDDACMDLGVISEIEVVDGGRGYREGPVIVSDDMAGSGLNATCMVDDEGRITEVKILNGMYGTGYGMGLPPMMGEVRLPMGVRCPSACDEITCGVSSKSGEGGELVVKFEEETVAVSAAMFQARTGTLELQVRDKIDTSTKVVFSFELENSLVPQEPRDAYIMVSGRSPVASARFEEQVMGIAGLDTTVTAVCVTACADDAECECQKTLSNIPTDRPVYALKAEMQCNGMASDVTVLVDDEEVEVEQPECADSCSTYSTLFSWVNVAEHAKDGELELVAKALELGTDFCGAGDNLKVLFTLMY